MWHDLVLKAYTLVSQFMLGFLNTCSEHPMLTVGFLAFGLVMACAMWLQVLGLRLEATRVSAERPIRLGR